MNIVIFVDIIVMTSSWELTGLVSDILLSLTLSWPFVVGGMLKSKKWLANHDLHPDMTFTGWPDA